MNEKRIESDGKDHCTTACCGGPSVKKPSSRLEVPSFEADLAALRAAPNVPKLEAALKAGAFPTLADHTKVVTDKRTYYWSMAPGRYVDKNTGDLLVKKTKKMVDVSSTTLPGVEPRTEVVVRQEREVQEPVLEFTGTIREWREALQERITEISNDIFRKHLLVPNLVETSPVVVTLLFTAMGFESGKWEEASPFSSKAENKLFGRFALLNSKGLSNRISVKLVSQFKAEIGNVHAALPEIDVVALDQPAVLANYELVILDMPII